MATPATRRGVSADTFALAASARLPPQFREMAERNVEQAKQAYGQYLATAEQMLSTLEEATRQAWAGARDVNLLMLGFADANARAGFDYADRFLKAKDIREIAALQRDYMRHATERLSLQMREVQYLASEATRHVAEASEQKS